MKWFNTLSHNRWLEQETDRIFDFGKNSVVPTGFGWLGNKGQIKEEMGTHLWITARMLHVYSVAAAMGRPGAYSLVDHGIKAMNGALRDKKYGGWYACVNDEGVVDASKQGYQHFFALLGAASAVTTGHPEARKLLDYTIEIIEKYFWSEEEQMCLESWDEAFSKTEEYRGGNANMHAVEAFLIVYDVTHDKKWLDRAIRVASVIIHDVARNNHYRVNEHFRNSKVLNYCWNTIPEQGGDEVPYKLANAGYPVILCNVGNFYLDMAYCYHVEEPGLRWGGYVDEYVTFDMLPFDIYKSLRRNLKGEPVDVKAASNGKQPLTKEGYQNIKGLSGQIWSETIRSFEQVEYYLFPKVFGLAERAWNVQPSLSPLSPLLWLKKQRKQPVPVVIPYFI